MKQILDRDGHLSQADALTASRTELLEIYRLAKLTRRADEEMLRLQAEGLGDLSFFVPSFGEETAHVAATLALEFDDLIFRGLRGSGIALARGVDLHAFFAAALGCDQAMGRSLPGLSAEPEFSICCGSARPAASLMPAVGAARALALKGQAQPRIAVAFFGVGSTQHPDFAGALELATHLESPVLFLATSDRQGPSGEIAARAENAGVSAEYVDGDDAIAVFESVRSLSQIVRQDGRPGLIEMAVEFPEPGGNPGSNPAHDRLGNFLKSEGLLPDDLSREINRAIDREVVEARDAASNLKTQEPRPPSEQIFAEVLCRASADLEGQDQNYRDFDAEYGGSEDPDARCLL
ncbi:MAG: thiamine pyrophosphate-dependent enzyme [Planctomycetota bacterium]